ncbi:hypothetical protein BS50DRAFT_626789 [Corynespora cassiicola Philippines]|uniref:Rhodopsin domain-containing protein n=1 Tax=Corynespora cassiicola Philippines TaxID=1448308 RepID=A0A2T2N1P8_CORCC|nr:hypothetical protein BS50DRAFT_626789 [Corynespora cassiicola Philippines]
MRQTVPIENGAQVGIIVVSTISIFIVAVSVGLRLVAKQISKKMDYSDYCILVALLWNTALHTCCMLLVTRGGFGFHTQDIFVRFGPDVATFFFKGIMSFALLWNATVCFSKLSILLMYTALIPIPFMVHWARGIGLVIILWNVGNIIAGFLICRPFAKNWDFAIPGTCGSQPDYYFAMGVINIITDIILIILPMPYLYQLQLPLKKKLLAMAMLSVGIMTWVITIYRQTLLPGLDFTDMTYTGVLATMLSGLEPSVAIALACLPLLRPLCVSRKAHQHSGYDYGSGGDSELYSGKDRKSSSRPFTELNDNDDSSEVQLTPMKPVQNVQVSTSPENNSDRSVGLPVAQAITVERRWEVQRSH